MYKSANFEEKDAQKVWAFMQAHPFITLIGFDGMYPVATQVPVQLYQDELGLCIVGHVMKKTDHHDAFARNENVLALFTGAHAYVSASVYEKPTVASTWNYSSVQAKGKIRLMDEGETREAIKQLTNSYENPATSKAAFHHMTDDYVEKNLKAISGFEIRVESLANVFKLSQNHTETNRRHIIENLEQHGNANAQQVALEMKKRL